MKPIFEQERLFLNELLSIDLPTYCWRQSSKIYLDCTCGKPIYQFKVEDNIARLVKDNTKLFEGYTQKNIEQLIDIYSDDLKEIEEKTKLFFYDYIFRSNHRNDDKYVIGHSSGKDSTVLLDQWIKFLIDLKQNDENKYNEISLKWEINFANTSNDTADTYRYTKSLPNIVREYIQEVSDDILKIMNPKEGWTKWLERKNYFIPTTMTRNCCSTYKEGQITKFYSKDDTITHFIGVRKYESSKRSNYDYVMDYEKCEKMFGSYNFPKSWTKACPIVEWRDEHVWLYILKNNLRYNPMYEIGFQRVGCLLCPYQSNYNDLLIQKYYTKRWEWWMGVIEKNYENFKVKDRLHWTLEEYKNGKWKTGISKIQELISKKYTDEKCEELSNLLGITFEMARKYWNRECECGKKCNPTEIAMFYKMYGRYEGRDDNRRPICKKCMCKQLGITQKQYQEKYIEFRDGGCNLF